MKTGRNSMQLAATLLVASLSVCSFQALSTPRDNSSAGLAQETNRARGGNNLSPQVRNRVRQAVASVGLIVVRDSNTRGRIRPRGSAVLVRSDGVVVTNYHVIIDSRTNRLYPDMFFTLAKDGVVTISETGGYRLKPSVINREKDLALLRIESNSDGDPLPESLVFPAIEIGDSNSIKLLDDVIVIGFPEKGGLTVTLSQGMVEGHDILDGWIKTDARVIHGNSGGAAVDSDGKLIGIPTKVVADSQPIDSNGDGFPDAVRQYGAVGFLRPSHLVAAMIGQLDGAGTDVNRELNVVKVMPSTPSIQVKGIVKAAGGKPVAGARIGLVPLGSKTVTQANLLTWGGTNAEGKFTLNKSVPPGQYTIKASALGYEPYTGDVEIGPKEEPVVIELRPSRKK